MLILSLLACHALHVPPRPAVSMDVDTSQWQGTGYVDTVWATEVDPIDAENPAILMVGCFQHGTATRRSGSFMMVFPAGFSQSKDAILNYRVGGSMRRARMLSVEPNAPHLLQSSGSSKAIAAMKADPDGVYQFRSLELFNEGAAKFAPGALPPLTCS